MRILLVVIIGVFFVSGCGNNSKDPTVRIVAVLQRPAVGLSWANERDMLQLTPEEKKKISDAGVTGELEVVYTAGRGSGSPEVRVVIIQAAPLLFPTRIPVPINGSVVYLQERGVLKQVVTNSALSSLILEIKQETNQTMFYMDYPRDMTRYGGAVFWWDANGKWHEL